MLNRVMFFGYCALLGGILLGPTTAQGQDFFEDAAAAGDIHKYDAAGEMPTAARPYFQFDFLDIPATAGVSETVNGTAQWTIVDSHPFQVVIKTLLGEWAPGSPVAIVQGGISEADPINTINMSYSFQAPSTAGTYRIRLAMSTGIGVSIQQFFGDGPFNSDSTMPGVADYVEVTITITDSICGDGTLDADEVCDDGNTTDCDSGGCRGDCSAVETGCGDGFLCGIEVCDDGNTINCDGCFGDCMTIETGCGDGVTCGIESCDDGNTVGGDGCSADCSLADFEYECRIRRSPSLQDHVTSLPANVGSIIPGDSVYVEFWATDSGLSNPGVVSAYADVDYPESLLSCVDFSIEHTLLFSLQPEGVCDGFIVDELGGSQVGFGFGVDPEWTRIAYAQFIADTGFTGVAEFVLQPATTESSAFGRGLVPTSSIKYGTCSVVVTGTCPCIFDLDNNCNIGGGDLGVFAPCWSLINTDPTWDTLGCVDKDFDCNGTVSGGDLGWFAAGWNRSCFGINASIEYPPCRVCSGPVTCPSAASRSLNKQPVTSLKLDPQSSPADSSVLLSLSLQKTITQAQSPMSIGRIALGWVKAGEHVFAEVWAKDLDASADGLTAVFADIQFDASKFVVVSVDSDETFTLFADPIIQENVGIVSHVGGATLDASHGAGAWTRVGVVELEALVNVIRPTVSLSPSQGEAVSLYGLGLVPVNEIRVISGQSSKVKAKRNGVR